MSVAISRYKTKKRKKVASLGIHRVLEIKQYNPFMGAAYDSVWWVPTAGMRPANTDVVAYEFKDFNWPVHGTESNHRVGNKINVKSILLKGYVCVYEAFFASLSRVKLYLVREYGTTDIAVTDVWKNWEEIDQNDDVFGLMSSYRHNYYSAMIDYDHVGRAHGVVVTKVFEIELKNPHTSQENIALGATATSQAWTGLARPARTGNLVIGYVPINTLLRINETVDCEVDRYHFVLFCDTPYGVTNFSLDPLTFGQPTLSKTSVPFSLKFFTRVYYTDP